MLSNISWSQYLTGLVVTTIVYYLFIWVAFFKTKFSILPGLSGIHTSLYGEDSPDEVISTAQHVIDEPRPLFRSGTAKNELLFAIQQSLHKYNNWDEPGFRDTINQFISRECGTICSIRLSEDEISALWK